MLSRLIALFQEKVENRCYGKYRGLVADNNDPKNLGRLKVKVPALMGENEIGWAMPCLPYGGGPDRGLYMVPENGDGVWVEFEAGNISYPIWSGTWWAKDETPKGASGGSPAPDIKMIKSKSGHVIELNDAAGSESVTITDKHGNKVVMDSSAIDIDSGTRELKLKGNNITVEATVELKLKGATVNVEASGEVTVKGATVNLNP